MASAFASRFVLLVILFCSVSCAFTLNQTVSLVHASSRISKSFVPTATSLLPPLPPVPSSNLVHSEDPIFTGGVYRVSANFIKFPSDVADIINKARSEKKPVEVYAIHIAMSGSVQLSGIPNLKIISHTCTFLSTTYFTTRGTRPSYKSRSAAQGVTPSKPPRSGNSGSVYLMCSHLASSRSVTVSFFMQGTSGLSGQRGGKGRNGIDGTPGVAGRCRKKKIFGIRIKCKKSYGRAGKASTAGTSGARGGSGGDGGNGGNLSVTYQSSGRFPLKFLTYEKGGIGGPGGYGGLPGKNGKYIAPILYMTSCSRRCNPRQKRETRPTLPTLRSGARGSTGRAGRSGYSVFAKSWNPQHMRIGNDDFVRFFGLAERYYNNLVLSGSASAATIKEATAVMDTVAFFADIRGKIRLPGYSSALVRTMGERARLAKKAVQLRAAIFGPAALSRAAPTSLGAEVSAELRYADALQAQMSTSRLQSNVLGAVTEAAAISIPATNFNALRADLRAQRDKFRRAVLDTEARIEDAAATIREEVDKHVIKKKEAADRERQKRMFKALTSIVNIAVGVASLNFKSIFSSTKTIIGTIKDIKVSFDDIEAITSTVEGIRDDFKQLRNETKEIKELLSTAQDVASHVSTVRDGFKKAAVAQCSFADLQALMRDAPDRVDKFPNLVVYDSDFAQIDDIGAVAELSKALVKVRASKLTAQFSCVLGDRLEDVPSVRVAFDNFFTLTTTRIDVLARMVDIDIELRQLKVREDGVLAQRDSLKRLRSSAGSLSARGNALAALAVAFERARMRTVEVLDRLATSYENVALRSFQPLLNAFAKEQLSDNGVCGFQAAKQYARLARLHADLRRSFQGAMQCTAQREVPGVTYYSFDITAADSPEVFGIDRRSGGLRTGADNRTAIMLDIAKHCAMYGGNHPPPRMLATPGAPPATCFPNKHTYNARMVSIAVELVGGDDSKLPPGRRSVFASISQAGPQTFHAKPGHFKSVQMKPLQFALGFIPLTKAAPPAIVYHTTCFVGGAGLTSVSVDSPRVCPSPFSAYSLQLGYVHDERLKAYLATVQAIRIHTKLVAYSNSNTASVCFE
ncbi:hypothetical protein BWQ96_07747 [Gracilariopsis chorda]|uniref:Uncharacterized protein n=1 Tax=Gracilariopsis chorda TaxID=448386 RepID=A0A2V3IN33_9FLOR|nr:hypothetical protein BWQ96_07747 [Gracilariopsis chorda]|eukprot:PXF42530.1 hypothetical protein BWQ96_07747 [Gracilariopsis chorda]